MKYQASSFLLFLHLTIASLGLAVGQEQQDETDELYLSSEKPGLRERTQKFQEFNDFESDHHHDLDELVVLPQEESSPLDDEDEDEVVGHHDSSSPGFKDFVGYHHQDNERSLGSARPFDDFELDHHLPEEESLSLEDEDELVDADASSSGFEDFVYNHGGNERGMRSLVRSSRILRKKGDKKNNKIKKNKKNNNVAAPVAPKIRNRGNVKKLNTRMR